MEEEQNRGGLDTIPISGHNSSKNEKEKIIILLDSFIRDYKGKEFFYEDNLRKQILKRINRSRKEFDATRFFVLIVGPLKSGKSTFVNILSRSKVSPTDVLECTAIPTIIGKAEATHRDKIVQYFIKDQTSSDDDAKSEIFNMIIDTLRGIEEEDSLSYLADIKVDEATDDNIRDIVMQEHSIGKKKPMIATIGVKGSTFIDDEIMIIDMPGLDGQGANDKNPLYQKMVERADFIFFVQSSTAAINEATSEFLDWLLAGKLTEVPLRLIHNIHESLYYLNDDVTINNTKRQIAAGYKYIKDRFKINCDFDNYALNFAKISNGVMGSGDVKSDYVRDIDTTVHNFEEFETKIVEALKNDRQKIKETNCISKAKGNIEISIKDLKTLSSSIDEEIKENNEAINNANSITNQLSIVKISSLQLMVDIDNLLKEELITASLKNSIESKSLDIINKANAIKGKDLIQEINSLILSFNDTTTLGTDSSFRNILITYVQTLFTKTFANIINEISSFLSTGFGRSIIINDTINPSYIPDSITSFYPRYYDIREKAEIFGITNPLINKKYSYIEHKEYLKKNKDDCINDIPLKIQSYKDSIEVSLTAVKSDFLKSIHSQIDDLLDDLIESKGEANESLNKQLNLINEMILKLTIL